MSYLIFFHLILITYHAQYSLDGIFSSHLKTSQAPSLTTYPAFGHRQVSARKRQHIVAGQYRATIRKRPKCVQAALSWDSVPFLAYVALQSPNVAFSDALDVPSPSRLLIHHHSIQATLCHFSHSPHNACYIVAYRAPPPARRALVRHAICPLAVGKRRVVNAIFQHNPLRRVDSTSSRRLQDRVLLRGVKIYIRWIAVSGLVEMCV